MILLICRNSCFMVWSGGGSGWILAGEDFVFCFSFKKILGTSLVAQWLRIHLPMQGTWVRSLVREDPTCRGATKPVRHNYWACALECPRATTAEARAPTARAPQQEKPPQWETRTPQWRVSPATRESLRAAKKTQHSQKKKKKKN